MVGALYLKPFVQHNFPRVEIDYAERLVMQVLFMDNTVVIELHDICAYLSKRPNSRCAGNKPHKRRRTHTLVHAIMW